MSTDYEEVNAKLKALSNELEGIKSVVHALVKDMQELERYVSKLPSVPKSRNCARCGKKILAAGGKCHACGHQN